MQVIEDLASLEARPRAVTIGMFDGVHAGHRDMIEHGVEIARQRGLTSTVLTFAEHPLVVLAGEHAPQLLSSNDERVRLLSELKADELVLLPFDTEMAAMDASVFCRDILQRQLDTRVVVVGENFHFGAAAHGDVAMLGACGAEHGFETIIVPLLKIEGAPVSSTRIRALLAEGDVAGARVLLGRPPSLNGVVVHGVGRGRVLGTPTANLVVPSDVMLPGDGVYIARALLDDEWHRAAVSIGTKPTFAGDRAPDTVEAFLFDCDEDIYGRDLRLDFIRRIRGQIRFDSAEALQHRVHQDIAVTFVASDPAFEEVGLFPPGPPPDSTPA